MWRSQGWGGRLAKWMAIHQLSTRAEVSVRVWASIQSSSPTWHPLRATRPSSRLTCWVKLPGGHEASAGQGLTGQCKGDACPQGRALLASSWLEAEPGRAARGPCHSSRVQPPQRQAGNQAVVCMKSTSCPLKQQSLTDQTVPRPAATQMPQGNGVGVSPYHGKLRTHTSPEVTEGALEPGGRISTTPSSWPALSRPL